MVTRGLTRRAAPGDPWDAARRALVEGESGQALAALEAAGAGPSPPEALPFWRALALVGAHDGPGAARVLAGAIDLRAPASPQYRVAVRLLCTRGERLAPVLRAALGPGYLQLFYDVWTDAIHPRQLGEPLMRALLEHAPDLDGVGEADVPGLGRPLLEVVSILRLARAAIYTQLRYSASAHRELEQADLALVAGLDDGRRLLGTVLYRLAVLDLADDRLGHAFEHLAAARALSAPEMFADILRADLELTALHGDPRWRVLLGE